MKKKLLIALLAITAALCCAFGFTACGSEQKNENNNGNADKWGNIYTVEAAYAVATDLGYTGTLKEFIESISGKDGTDGKDGTNGLSAFEIYVKSHPDYDGTEQEWIESLKGADGENGKDGENANGIDEAYIDADGNLMLILTNGKEINCGHIKDIRLNESLQYAAVKEDGKIAGYNVIGLGNVSDMDIVIPSSYNGKSVLDINFISASEREQITSVVISEGITSISDNAFNGCKYLESVTIPDSVTAIGASAFSGCSSIESISIPSSVTTIGKGAFHNCSGLESIIVDKENPVYHSVGNCLIERESKTLIRGCKDSVIPADGSVTVIDDGAFSACSGLTNITMPVSITAIGIRAFYFCGDPFIITYSGNKEQWLEIDKTVLFESFGTHIVYFNDGSSMDVF